MYAKGFDKQKIAILRQWLGEAQKTVIVTHKNADGDACGSMLGLARRMEIELYYTSKSIIPMVPDTIPPEVDHIPLAGYILSGESSKKVCEMIISEADLIIGVDFNTLDRTGSLQEALRNAKARKVLIDHHHYPAEEEFGLVFSDPDISSTCELVLWLMQELWGNEYLTSEISECLYTGLKTDTGSFAYSCSQPSCFEAAALLVSRRIQPAEIHNHIFNNFSINRMRFYGFAISQRLYVYPEQKTAIFVISNDDQQRFGVTGRDMEGLVNYTLMMREMEIGVLIREREGYTKVSFRSKNKEVNTLASQLGGGGHTKAAAADCHMPFDQAVATVKKLLGLEGIQPLENA